MTPARWASWVARSPDAAAARVFVVAGLELERAKTKQSRPEKGTCHSASKRAKRLGVRWQSAAATPHLQGVARTEHNIEFSKAVSLPLPGFCHRTPRRFATSRTATPMISSRLSSPLPRSKIGAQRGKVVQVGAHGDAR